MKCFEYRQGYILPGIAATDANNQSYIDLAGAGYEPGCKVFLTDLLVDQLYESQDRAHVKFAELALQGDGNYWLTLPKSSAKAEWALIYFMAGKQSPGEYTVDFRNNRNSVVHRATYKAYGEGTISQSLGFITQLAPGEAVIVRHEVMYKVAGTGRTLCQPFNKKRYSRYTNAVITISYYGTDVEVSHT